MKAFAQAALIFLVISCTGESDTSNTESLQNDSLHIGKPVADSSEQVLEMATVFQVDFSYIDSLFPHSNLSSFTNARSFEEHKYRRLSQEEYRTLFQDSSQYTIIDRAYCFSRQGDFHGLKKYVFVKMEEGYGTMYYLNTYNKEGKKNNSFIIASAIAVDGMLIDESSVFVNDSVISKTTIDCSNWVDEDGNEQMDCDSVEAIYDLGKDGRIQLRDL